MPRRHLPSQGRPQPEPIHHVVERSRRSDLLPAINALARVAKVFYCVNSNERAKAVEQRLRAETNLNVHRVISKARYLVEYLEANGATGFVVHYQATPSPYAAPVIDREATLASLQAALAAQRLSGLNGLDSSGLLKWALESRRAPPIDATALDVCVITTPGFLARTLSWRRPWWAEMGLVDGSRYVDMPYTHKEGGKTVPVISQRVVAIFENPKEDEFDTHRWVHPSSVDGLLKNEGVHDLFEEDGEWYERRPKDQVFGSGLRRGCQRDGIGPQALILTSSQAVAQGAVRCLERTSTRYWRLSQRQSVLRGL